MAGIGSGLRNLNSAKMKKAGIFALGVAAGTVGLKLLKSKEAKKVCTEVTAAGLRAKDAVMKTATTIQENAGDVLAEAKQLNEERAAEAEAKAAVAEEMFEDVAPEANAEAPESTEAE